MVLLNVACTTPLSRAETFAHKQGFEESVVTGNGYAHRIWRKPGSPPDPVLHVYIDGDGTPYPTPDTVSPDPVVHEPLMLHLMALDPHPSVYVGRPCYWGLRSDAGCSPSLWTLGRFSPAVIDSMTAVIIQETGDRPPSRRVLYGHSGGATLALLIASRGLELAGIVTIGGNLDPDAWARLHGYTPLIESLNPIRTAPKAGWPAMRHYVGDADRIVPAALVRDAAARIGGEVIVVPGFDHHCCWQQIWSQALEFP
jgi:pimeloyl-ACP methyl ester carboxylesterase